MTKAHGIRKYQLIEVVSNGIAGGNLAVKIQFPDQPYLRNKLIWGIDVYNSLDMTTTPSGNTPTTQAQSLLSFLTIYCSDADKPSDLGEWINLVPFSRLHLIQNGTPSPFSRIPFSMVGQKVQWEKCYITLATPLANVANVSFMFGVYFSVV